MELSWLSWLSSGGCSRGSQVSVDDRWCVVVQIHQTFGHILKNGDLRAEGDIGCALQKLAQAALQSLRDQHREPGVGEETDAQKLDDVRVAEVGEKTTYFVVPFHHALSALALEVDEGIVELLSCADQSVDFKLRGPLGPSAQQST